MIIGVVGSRNRNSDSDKKLLYSSTFIYNNYAVIIKSLFQVQDKDGIEIIRRFKGIGRKLIPTNIYNSYF